MNENTVHILSIHVYERENFKPIRVAVEVTDAHTTYTVGEWFATAEFHGEAAKLAEQALWAWSSSGLVGLVAYVMSRPDVWSELPNS